MSISKLRSWIIGLTISFSFFATGNEKQVNSMKDVIGDWEGFIAKIFESLTQAEIDVSAFELDHMCYRTDTDAHYLEMKEQLQGFGNQLIEADIGGRPIATYELHEPLVFLDRKISVIELAAPKPSKSYPRGLEHVEFATGSSPHMFIKSYPKIDFDKSGLDKEINPDARIEFAGFSVKFHEKPLKEVILEELQSKL